MKRFLALTVLLASCLAGGAQVFNREPLEASLYAAMPLGSVRAEGWLREQLSRQASGLTGHLDEAYPEVMGPSNAWLGGDGDAWERGPYWIDGLLPLAYILDDRELIGKASAWVEAIIASQQEDGYIGPGTDHSFVYGLQRGGSHDWWPKMVALKILQQYYCATADTRALDCLKGYFHYQAEHLPETPLDKWSDWGRWRGADNLNVIYWLYNITGEEWLIDLGRLIHSQTTDWTDLFTSGGIFSRQGSVHCVNLAQGFKAPAVWWQFSHDRRDLTAQHLAVQTIRHTVGFPTGLWAGDEMLHFGAPTRGSELCTAVEMMYSLEETLRITGDIRWADYLERVAYNALPTQITDDFTGKQYYQQVNQVSCEQSWRTFSTPHDDTDVLFGTLNGYPCCLSNMHQGWPKFTANLWYASADGGLAALVYAPSSVKAKVAGGIEVKITESTDYPFKETIDFTVDFTSRKVRKAVFPLRLRVPGWCAGAAVSINGTQIEATPEEGIILLDREWKKGDRICLTLPMDVRTEAWFDQAWSVVRGPLVYALKMDEEWTWKPFKGAARHYGEGAWEVSSPTPWNYCLMRDSFSSTDCLVTENPVSTDYPWNVQNAPVSITVPARTLPHWKDVGSVAFWTEDGDDSGADCQIELIPYGCTTLRIAAFPTRIVPWDLPFRKQEDHFE